MFRVPHQSVACCLVGDIEQTDSNEEETSQVKVDRKEATMSNGKGHSAVRNLQQLPSACGDATYTNQASLPRLPIPKLVDTMEKFKAHLKALLTADELVQVAGDVEAFMNGEGPQLQKALQEYEEAGVASGSIGSYVEEFWNESYLSPDASVVLNLNPFFLLEAHPDPKIAGDQLKSAASLCFAALKMASVVRHQKLAPDIFKGQALCMDQFKALFGSSRQPADGCDDVHVFNDSCHGE